MFSNIFPTKIIKMAKWIRFPGYLLGIILTDLLILSLTSASNIYRGTTFREAQFIRKYKGRIHAATPINKFDVSHIEHCTDKCLETTDCKSINFNGALTADNCHLIAEDRNTQYNYIDKDGWDHYDTGRTELTRIFHVNTGMCLIPGYVSCTFSSGHGLVFKSGTDCDQPYAWFRFNRDTGSIYHMCSGARYCPMNDRLNDGAVAFQETYCSVYGASTVSYGDRFKRIWDHKISLFTGYCLHAYHGEFVYGGRLIQYNDCIRDLINFEMRELGNGPVKVSIYSEGENDFNSLTRTKIQSDYSLIATQYLDTFEFVENYPEKFIMLMQAIFIPPETGEYFFFIGCDDWCKLLIGVDENEATAYQIAYNDGDAVAKFTYSDEANQISPWLFLEKDKKYYMEVLLRDSGGDNWVGIAMKAPTKYAREQVTTEHLYPIGI